MIIAFPVVDECIILRLYIIISSVDYELILYVSIIMECLNEINKFLFLVIVFITT